MLPLMTRLVTKGLVTTRRTCFCVLSTCKNVGKRRASVRGEYRLRTESYGFWEHADTPTYNSLTTCATNDARNRSRPDVAIRPHSYTLRNRASDERVTCVDATPSPPPGYQCSPHTCTRIRPANVLV
ncbi:hypothetical protein Bbelb_019840 [Branchiostoma belcheri]|nr:hypothetical protein Bbelb_019840 [Branchiostoma belcheri]